MRGGEKRGKGGREVGREVALLALLVWQDYCGKSIGALVY